MYVNTRCYILFAVVLLDNTYSMLYGICYLVYYHQKRHPRLYTLYCILYWRSPPLGCGICILQSLYTSKVGYERYGRKVSYSILSIMYDSYGVREYQFRILHRSCRRRTEPNRTKPNRIAQDETLEFSRVILALLLSPPSGRARGLRLVRFSHNLVLYMTATNFT